jgi:3-deoxy-D-manno-octulosonic-acid transferase
MSFVFYWLYSFLMLILSPFTRLLLPFLSEKAKSRIEFEMRNIVDTSCLSFHKIQEKADFAFEVSSEGELEQCLPLINEAIVNNKKIEIIYCSESAEGKCIQIYKKHPAQVRLLRMPLLTFNFWSQYHSVSKWLTAPVLILCRYDFFPELFIYGLKRNVKFYLVWGTLKNKEKKLKNAISRFYLKLIYNQFDKIITATEKDQEYMKIYLGIEQSKLKTYDFRIFQISKRIKDKEQKLNRIFPAFEVFNKFLHTVDKKKRMIIGNFWSSEIHVLNYYQIKQQLEAKCVLAIVPHKVDPVTCEQNIVALKEKLLNQIPIYLIDQTTSKEDVIEILENYKKRPGILYINLKGILVEFYNYFQLAYVGGGFHHFVHSLLEPYVAGCKIICGPKTERSTEIDFINENASDLIYVANHFEEVQEQLKKQNNSNTAEIKLDQYLSRFQENYWWLIS